MDLFVCSSFEQGGPDEAYRRQQMSREAAAVCRGALAAGGERILVKDGCGTGYNIDPQLLPSEAQLNRGCAQDVYGRMSGIQRGGWDAAAFTGFANRCPGVHTESIEINGLIGSEFLLCAYAAGLENVPVCFVSGDAAVCEQARRLIPSIAIV
uniref:M55 family metallopeptidase n=1 Tax=uncultured Ruthenibacterium sp. TaxID=1905347 RepID=UPI00349EEC72